jgi:GDP-L-fucose synthase
MDYKKILVTGGSGMVGKSLKEIMPNAIYLSSKDCDLTNYEEVLEVWNKYKPNTIIHLAAKVGGIIDNINYPADYFEDNILMNTNIMKASRLNNVDRLIAILSTCIYPDKLENYPITEDMLHLGPPTPTNFSYGYAKRSLAVHIDSYNQQYKTKYQYLIPCNLYGEFDKYGENSHFVAALIKKIELAKNNNQEEINLFGTGNPLRQFIHSSDLAYIIKYCLENNIYENLNVATEENLSIKQIAEIVIEEIGEGKINKINFDSTKPDGQFRKDVSIDKLNNFILNFSPLKLRDGIKQTYSKIDKNILK